jgi:CheY-like chemotaxis protein
MKQILIVDDEKPFLLSLTEGLKSRLKMIKVLTAHNGKEAVKVLKSTPVDLLVTDLKMPEMDGFELLAVVSAKYATIPVIVMTAFGTPGIEERLNQLGYVQYLEKPMELAVLADKIKQNLAASAKGFVQGITLPTFVQLMELEKKTCSLLVRSNGKAGVANFLNGELVDAKTGFLSGEDAAYEIFAWADVVIEMKAANSRTERSIHAPLNHILMEALRIKDEKNWSEKGKRDRKQAPQAQKEEDRIFNNIDEVPEASPNPEFSTQIEEEHFMTVQEKLKEFTGVEGFAGVGVFTPAGESLAMLTGDAKFNLMEVGVLANNVLMNAQKASLDMGTGRGQLVHIEAENAHILVRCLNEGTDPLKSQPGKTHIHLVLLLASEASLGMAKLKIGKIVETLADDFRM